MLDWEPKVDPRTGLARTIEWFRRERERDGVTISASVDS
jgi:nucleoside-diphosphate-sugar epimerase